MHTTATDGKATLDEMVAAAQARGLKYIAITDHSKRVSAWPAASTPARLRDQWQQIDKLNKKLEGLTCPQGHRVRHSGKRRHGPAPTTCWPKPIGSSPASTTAKISRASRSPSASSAPCENPHVSAIAHPTGRLINRRKPYEVDLDAVFKPRREHGKLLELNANPARLDLDDVACAAAKSHGIPIVINTDAHSTEGLSVMRYGILQARRAGLTKADVANTLPLDKFLQLVAKGRN